MSQGHAEIVRKPLRARQRSSRTLDQRILLRFPRLNAAYLRLVGRLRPSSRLRQAVSRRGARMACEALNRRDLDAYLLGYAPGCEIHPAREWVEAGLMEPRYRGPAGYREFVARWSEVWGADWRVEPVEFIDLGDRYLVITDQPVRGQASGVPITQKLAAILTLKDGLVIHQQEYFDPGEALEAVGLRE